MSASYPKDTTHYPALKQPYWLPVELILYKVLLLTYKALRFYKVVGPQYLIELLSKYIPWCTVRSSNDITFIVPRNYIEEPAIWCVGGGSTGISMLQGGQER